MRRLVPALRFLGSIAFAIAVGVALAGLDPEGPFGGEA